jgi:NAD(P)-dependent dehydrogenase (short-subunit alcohol dehydrogenase family)
VPDGRTVIVGGTAGLGLAVAEHYAREGADVVVAGRDAERAGAAAARLDCEWRSLDLAQPGGVADALRGLGPVRRLVLSAIERDENSVREYDVERAVRLVTLKLVGYTAVAHALAPDLADDAAILLFGGQALRRPYPGSTTITTVNGGVVGVVHTLAVELAPVRVNALHPGVVGDTAAWASRPAAVLDALRERTPTGRLVTTQDVVGAAVFLLENAGVNGVNLELDGGWTLK